MKRTFTTILCTLLLVAVLAGCGSTGGSANKEKTSAPNGTEVF